MTGKANGDRHRMKHVLDYAAISEAGSREINEDCVRTAENGEGYCFVVCDGLGGHGMGDTASHLAADVFMERFRSGFPAEDFLPRAFLLAQDCLTAHQRAHMTRNKMRTTAAVMAADGADVYIGHVGDSRVYVFDECGIKTRTRDHSVPQMLALAGEITEGEIRGHPDRNVLLRAMGTEWERPMFELLPPIRLSECRAFLICSDGFWEYIRENEMLAALDRSKTADGWLGAMKAVIEKNGSQKKMDNYSAVAVINPERCGMCPHRGAALLNTEE